MVVAVMMASKAATLEYPEGYYPFEEAPGKIPPSVSKPPYLQLRMPCSGKWSSSSGTYCRGGRIDVMARKR